MGPASMTGVLQPLDVYAFAGLKKRHRDFVLQESLKAESGALNVVTHCAKLLDAVQEYISAGTWRSAFRGCGFGDAQQNVGSRARGKLQWSTGPFEVGKHLPTLQDLQAVWLRGKHVPIDDLFRLATRPVVEEDTCHATGIVPIPHPWHGRLRSRAARLPAPAAAIPATHTEAAGSDKPAPWRGKWLARGTRLWGLPPRPKK